MGHKKNKVLSILAASGLMGLAFVAAKPALALAGTEGNPILFCQNNSGTDFTRVTVGSYQKGKPTQHTFTISHLDPDGCSDPGDYRWSGNLRVTWTDSASGEWGLHMSGCDIPSVVPRDRKILCQPYGL
jgi:hypothetical protein